MRFLVLLVCLPVLAACIGFSSNPEPERFFVLAPISGRLPATQTARHKDSDHLFVGLGPIQFPSYLDRQQIMTRAGPNRLEASGYDRWAEPLAENFAPVLSENLFALLRTVRVNIYPWPQTIKLDYEVRIEILQFESNQDREALLAARWVVIDSRNRKSFRAGESRLVQPPESISTEASVAALSHVLGQLSHEIGEAIEVVETRKRSQVDH
jgi:uncharacterized lipoprotein YmbA